MDIERNYNLLRKIADVSILFKEALEADKDWQKQFLLQEFRRIKKEIEKEIQDEK